MNYLKGRWLENKKKIKQAGAELCQAQDKLEVIVYIGLKVEFEIRYSYKLRWI